MYEWHVELVVNEWHVELVVYEWHVELVVYEWHVHIDRECRLYVRGHLCRDRCLAKLKSTSPSVEKCYNFAQRQSSIQSGPEGVREASRPEVGGAAEQTQRTAD